MSDATDHQSDFSETQLLPDDSGSLTSALLLLPTSDPMGGSARAYRDTLRARMIRPTCLKT